MIVDGDGFFPVMVQVVQTGSGEPLTGATVTLEDAGEYRENSVDPEQQRHALPRLLGKAVETDASGTAVVFYYTHWSSSTIDDKTTRVSLPLRGTIVVKWQGKEIFRKSLEQWAKDAGYQPSTSSAPHIVVEMPAEKANEQTPAPGKK